MTPLYTELRFVASMSSGEVSALLSCPDNAAWLLVFGHGAGVGMRHAFMQGVAERLATHGIASFRYQFPYMENGRRRPDPRPVLMATVRSALSAAREAAGGLPLLAGGKSLGGRMTSMAAADAPLPRVEGLVFFGFPLHAAGEPSSERADHLFRVNVPMLFLQGSRDRLADLKLLEPICSRLGNRADLHVVEDADHSFEVLKRSGRTHAQVLDELARAVATWAAQLG